MTGITNRSLNTAWKIINCSELDLPCCRISGISGARDIACRFARIPEAPRHVDSDALYSNAALLSLAIEVITKAGRKSREQQLASIEAGASSNALRRN